MSTATVSIDASGCITAFDAGAEEVFGYRAGDVMGQRMAELIIPAPLRPAHEDGMARFLRTGEGFLLGRTIEITALHADGSVFPVELSLTATSQDPLIITGTIVPA